MKFLFDLLPVVLFFVAFKLADIYVATAVAIGTTVMQVAWLKLRGQRVPGMLWASFAIIVVFGGATLLLQDETFIKWKPTVLYWLFGVVLAAGVLGFRKNFVRAILGEQVRLPEEVWARLNWSWVAFFAGSLLGSVCAEASTGAASRAAASILIVIAFLSLLREYLP